MTRPDTSALNPKCIHSVRRKVTIQARQSVALVLSNHASEGWHPNAAPMCHTTLASTSATIKLSMDAAGNRSTTRAHISAVVNILWNALAQAPDAVVKRAIIPTSSSAAITNCTLCALIARTIPLETSAAPVHPSLLARYLSAMPAVAPKRYTTRSPTSVSVMSFIPNAAVRLMILAASLAVAAKSCIWSVVSTRGAVEQSTTIPRITFVLITRQLYTSAAAEFTILSGKAG